ncbi:MAG: hypothetical protein R3F59_03780 [Myxococcota bacterium]
MPIETPNLDDLRYSRVVEELVRRIPVYAPEWTNHNDADPGIALLQLFAYLTEQVGYRLDRVPDKARIELLKLLGIRLAPARAATSQVAFFLSKPMATLGFEVPSASVVTRRSDTTVTYETDTALDVVPAEVVAWLSTKNPFLWDLLRLDEVGTTEPAPSDAELPPKVPTPDCTWLTLGWDGKRPRAADLPLEPAPLLPPSSTGVAHPWLWVALQLNDRRDAGFLGVEVTLHVVLDDDEAPTATADVVCGPILAPGEVAPAPITWLSYVDRDTGRVRPVPGRIVDETDQLAHSGTIRFTVPFQLGAPTSWADLRAATVPEPLDACHDLAGALAAVVPNGSAVDLTGFHAALATALSGSPPVLVPPKPAVGHPLDPKLRSRAPSRAGSASGRCPPTAPGCESATWASTWSA